MSTHVNSFQPISHVPSYQLFSVTVNLARAFRLKVFSVLLTKKAFESYVNNQNLATLNVMVMGILDMDDPTLKYA